MRRVLLGLLIGAVVLAATPAWARWVWRDGKWQYVNDSETPPAPAPAKPAPPPPSPFDKPTEPSPPPEKPPEAVPPTPPTPPAPPPEPPKAETPAPEPKPEAPAPPKVEPPKVEPPPPMPEPPAPKPETPAPKPEAPAPPKVEPPKVEPPPPMPEPPAPEPAEPKFVPAKPRIEAPPPAPKPEPVEPGFVPAVPRTETLPPAPEPPAPKPAAPTPRPEAPAARVAPPAPSAEPPFTRPAPPVPRVEPPAPAAVPAAPKAAPAATEPKPPEAATAAPEASASERFRNWWDGIVKPGGETAIFEQARAELSAKDYRSASRDFKSFIKNYQASRNREEAMWLRAAALWGLEDYMSAFDQYEDLIKNYAGSPHYRDALLKEIEIADLYFGPTRRKVLGIPLTSGDTEAVEILRKVYEHQPTGDLANAVVQKIADYYWSHEKWAEAEDYYDKYCREYPNGPAARTAELRRAKCALERCRGSRYDTTCLQLAYDRLRQFKQKFPEDAEREGVSAQLAKIREMQAEALYETAINYYRTGKPLAAAFYVERLQQKFADTIWCEMSKQFMADISMKKEDLQGQAAPKGQDEPQPPAASKGKEKPGPKQGSRPKEEPKP